MNKLIIKDRIKSGKIYFSEGDSVICFNRKQNGHPRSLKEGVTYIVKSLESDGHLIVAQRSLDGVGFLQPIKVYKTYVIPVNLLRDIKLNSLLDETNL